MYDMIAPTILVLFGILSLAGGVVGYAWRRRNDNNHEVA
jgi:LPXTG-motif cell wall-anchored protein